MIFSLDAASHRKDLPDQVEIKSLEDLKALQDKYGDNSLVIDFDDKYGHSITIYDDYME